MERYHTIFRSESQYSANEMCLKLENQDIPVILSYNTDEQSRRPNGSVAGDSDFKVMVPERYQQRAMHLLLNLSSELDSVRLR